MILAIHTTLGWNRRNRPVGRNGPCPSKSSLIGVTPPINDATVHIITGGISPDYLKSFAQAHERADYDLVLVGYTSQSADGIAVAPYAAAHTKRLSFLIAHRPGLVAPTLMARKFATFDQLWNGRLAVHIIAGASDVENMMDGDAMEKPDRYRRAAEYLNVMHRAWAGPGPFDFEGEFYSARAARADVLPSATTPPDGLFRRLLGRRPGHGGRTLRCLRHVRRAIGRHGGTHGRFPGTGRQAWPGAALQFVPAPDHRRDGGCRLGQGGPYPRIGAKGNGYDGGAIGRRPFRRTYHGPGRGGRYP